MMAISTKQALTADEFWELPEIPGKRLELVDGRWSRRLARHGCTGQ